MRDIDQIFARLEKSAFRSRFRLGAREQNYLASTGLPAVLDHARRFVDERLAPANPHNDGKQTPFKGHPAFIAQHATATCCRSCLEKRHAIPRGHDLTADQRDHVVAVLKQWLETEAQKPAPDRDRTRP